MRWMTNDTLGNQGPPAAWLIVRHLDPDAEIILRPAETILRDAAEAGARTFYVKGGDFHKTAERTTFEALLHHFDHVGRDPALDRMAEIFNDVSLRVKHGHPARHPEAAGVRAIMSGMARVVPEPRARLTHLYAVFDALYHACGGRPAPPPRPSP